MRKSIGMLGRRYGMLEVIGEGTLPGYLHVRCDCGNEKDVLARSLRSGNTKSCGCLAKANPGRPGRPHHILDAEELVTVLEGRLCDVGLGSLEAFVGPLRAALQDMGVAVVLDRKNASQPLYGYTAQGFDDRHTGTPVFYPKSPNLLHALALTLCDLMKLPAEPDQPLDREPEHEPTHD